MLLGKNAGSAYRRTLIVACWFVLPGQNTYAKIKDAAIGGTYFQRSSRSLIRQIGQLTNIVNRLAYSPEAFCFIASGVET